MILNIGEKYLMIARGIKIIVKVLDAPMQGGWVSICVVKTISNPTTEIWDEGVFYSINPNYCVPLIEPNNLLKDML